MHHQAFLYSGLVLGYLSRFILATPLSLNSDKRSSGTRANSLPKYDQAPGLFVKREERDPPNDPYPNIGHVRTTCQTPDTDKAVFYTGLGEVTDGYSKFINHIRAEGLTKIGDVYPGNGYLDQSPGDTYGEWFQDWIDRFSGVFAEKAAGTVTVVIPGTCDANPDSVWSRIEYSNLTRNEAVTEIIRVDVEDTASTTTIWPVNTGPTSTGSTSTVVEAATSTHSFCTIESATLTSFSSTISMTSTATPTATSTLAPARPGQTDAVAEPEFMRNLRTQKLPFGRSSSTSARA